MNLTRTIATSIIALFILVASNGQAFAKADTLTALETRIIELTNVERAKHGLAPLKENGTLEAAAREHSQEMGKLGYFSHNSPTRGRRDVAERVVKAGMDDWSTVGENLAYYQGYAVNAIAARVVQDWMNSPGHRANILKKDYTMIGVGVSLNGDVCHATQVFAAQ